MPNNYDDKDLYTLAVLRYKEENPNLDLDNLFSSDWNLNKNYKLKVEIIAEAIQNGITVEETDTYKQVFVKE